MNENASAGVLNGLGEESLYLLGWRYVLITPHCSLFTDFTCTLELIARSFWWLGIKPGQVPVVCLRKQGGAAPLLPLSWADTLSLPMPHVPCWPKRATGSYRCLRVLGNFWSTLMVIAKLQISKTKTLRIKWESLTDRWNIWRGSTYFFPGLAWQCLI